ncbi:hypothetical protein l11_10790 [Neisseria weaveri LMG 5135]|nr:hypothetical protein l11_10790 [Neisseria weaveri LMG 5135]
MFLTAGLFRKATWSNTMPAAAPNCVNPAETARNAPRRTLDNRLSLI